MRNEKGFTLVELLAVILVLGLVLVIAVPSVNKYLKSSKQKAFDVQINTMVEAVETYANTFRKVLPQNNGEEVRITLGQLKAEGLIKNDMTDPKTDKYFDDSIEFTIRKNGNNYIYEADESTIITRNTKTNSPTIKLSGNIIEYYNIGDTFEEPGYVAFSYAGEEITNVVSDASTLTLTTTGVFKIKYTATDNNGVTTTAIRNIIVSEPEVTIKTYTNGEAVYFNPVTGVKCNAEDVTSSATGTNDTCMKWYAFLDSEVSSTVNLILNHNTTGEVQWNSYNRGTPDTVNAKLQTDVSNWNTNIKSTARLISANEINQIAPTNLNFDVWNSRTGYYFHTGLAGNSNKYEGAAGSNTYAWLFDNTIGCTTYGCNQADNGTLGYWTSSFAGSSEAWNVDCDGRLVTMPVSNSSLRGVRPVITVDKLLLR